MTMSFSWRPRALMGPAIIVMAAVIAVVPFLLRGPSCTGDLTFHFLSWIDAEHSMSTGLLYPHWANGPNFGAGQPEFVFYPPISWMGGAVLGMLLPWSFVPIALSFLLLTATGMANRALAREVLGDPPATLAGCAAIFLGYALFNVYARNDFSELTGGFWIPLLLLFALRRKDPSGNFWERTFDGSATPLALIVAGIWLSNVPLGIMASYLLAAVALVSALIEKSMVTVLRATASTVGGMGLASLYLIPAVAERNWVNVQNAVISENYAVENSWLFARHATPFLAAHDFFLHRVSIVAVAMLVIAFLGGATAWIRGVVPGEFARWLPIALIPPAVLFLLLPISLPVWNALPELRLLQFPWRWLVVLEAPMAICFASAVWFDRRILRIGLMAVCAAIFVGISLAASEWWFVQCGSYIASLQELAPEGIIAPGKPEYAPPGIRFAALNIVVDPQGNPLVDPLGEPVLDSEGNPLLNSLMHPNFQVLPGACLLDDLSKASVERATGFAPAWRGDAASCKSSNWQELSLVADSSTPESPRFMPEQKGFMGIAEHAGYLVLRLRYYPAWGVKVNGIPVAAMAERERGLMAVPVPQGKVQVSIHWTTTGDVVAGRWVSVIALLLLIVLHLFERKRLLAHLSPGLARSDVSTEKLKLPKVDLNDPVRSRRTERRNSRSRKPPKNPREK